LESSEIFKLVGSRIKELRLQKGLSQVELVGKMEGNIDATNISRIEAGRTNPTLLTLYRISLALEISLQEILKLDTIEKL